MIIRDLSSKEMDFVLGVIGKEDGATAATTAPVPKGTGCPNGCSLRQVAVRPVRVTADGVDEKFEKIDVRILHCALTLLLGF